MTVEQNQWRAAAHPTALNLADASDIQTCNGLTVLSVVDSVFPALGGAEIQAIKIANVLKQQGMQIEFIAPLLEPEKQLETHIDGIKLHRLQYPKIKLLGSLMMNLKFAHFLFKNRNRYDCIHIHTLGTLAVTAALLKTFIDLTVICKVSGYYEFSKGILRRGSNRKPFRLFMGRAVKNIDYVQSISQDINERLSAFGFTESQIQYMPNGVDTGISANLQSLKEKRTFTIGYSGRIREIKGVAVLIDAFYQTVIANPHRDIQLHIAGDGLQMHEINDLVVTYGLVDQVRLLGMVNNMPDFLSNLDLYVQPSFEEGLSNSLLEAMNQSLPVVVTNIGGNRDLVKAGINGYLFRAGDAHALSGLLKQCLTIKKSELALMGQQSRNIIEGNFSLDKLAQKLQVLYARHRLSNAIQQSSM